jgi:3',5'-nucleoside bisphosphate phosphatase
MKPFADLHIHTRYSDGSLGPEDIVRIAGERGLCCISITDHDSVAGIDEAIKSGEKYNVEVITGVEISAEESGREIHILGYCINSKDHKLLAFLGQIKRDRVERLFKIIECLNTHKIVIDAHEFMEFAGDVSISRLHIAKFMQKKGFVLNWRDAFAKYIGDGKPCYISSFRYQTKEVIDIIKSAGGVPVIAHPALSKVEEILPRLIAEGLSGIEAFHSEHSPKTARYYENFARAHNLLVTGGSDCHGQLKNEILIGKTKIPYSYVEVLKNASKAC